MPRFFLLLLSCLLVRPASPPPTDVRVTRVPEQGLQPRLAVATDGTVHLVYFKGDPRAGDLYYARRRSGAASFSEPIRVNSQPGTAIAMGTIRGAQIALGPDGRLHVLWNGSAEAEEGAEGPPLLYTRLHEDGTGFEPERNLIQWAWGLDGGGALAVDAQGRVFAFWHANPERSGEASRAVYLARSDDGGRTFTREVQVSPAEQGACGCCGMQALAGPGGRIFVLYRAAREGIHRDMVLLTSDARGQAFEAQVLHRWELAACPMSSATLTAHGSDVLAAWQTGDQLFLAHLGETIKPMALPGEGRQRKHPSLAVAPDGRMLVAYVEQAGWGTSGTLAWQELGPDGYPLGPAQYRDDLPTWSFPAVFVGPDGNLEIIY